VFFIERSGAVWDEIQQAAQSLSLFSARRMLEIRMPGGKPGVAGAAVLLQLFQAAGEDLLVLIVTGSSSARRSLRNGCRPCSSAAPGCRSGRSSARAAAWLRSRFAAAGADGERRRRWHCWPSAAKAICWPRARRSTSWRCCCRAAPR
jgi:DNA polymerase III delta subunit